ncbi:tetratricopeptide repeat protein [Anaerolineae bacterium CFX7]|nr:tetratricopeptide repeat protein [Anaerolineae bacterium CFX7]
MSTLAQELALLETRGLVRVTLERAKPIVRFKHALTREATFNSILHSRRVELHRAAAQTLMELNTAPDLEMALTIAEHWQRGNKDARALETILPHAQNLIYTGRSISLTKLLTQLQRENLNETEQRDLDMALADAHAARGEYELAREVYERVLQIDPTSDIRARVLHGLGVANYHLGNYARAIEYHEASLALAIEKEDVRQQAQALGGLGVTYRELRDLEHAKEFFVQSHSLGINLNDHLIIANAEYNLALLSYDQRAFAEAIHGANRALELYQELHNISYAAISLSVIGASYFELNQLDKAGSYYKRAIKMCLEAGNYYYAIAGLVNLGELYLKQGNLEQAAQTYTESLRYLDIAKNDRILMYAQLGLAQVSFEQSRLQQAHAHATNALEIAVQLDLAEQREQATQILDKVALARSNRASNV